MNPSFIPIFDIKYKIKTNTAKKKNINIFLLNMYFSLLFLVFKF